MEIIKTVNDNVVRLTLVGRLDTNTSPILEKEIDALNQSVDLVLDCKQLDYVSSAGLRILLVAQKKMSVIGSLTLENVLEDVMEVLDMTGFSTILNIK